MELATDLMMEMEKEGGSKKKYSLTRRERIDTCLHKGTIIRHVLPLATVTVAYRPFKCQIASDMRKRAFIMLPTMALCLSPSPRTLLLIFAEL